MALVLNCLAEIDHNEIHAGFLHSTGDLLPNGLVEPQEAYMKSNDKATMKGAFEKMNIKLDL